MWRFQARALIVKSSIQNAFSTKAQIPIKTLAQIPSPSPIPPEILPQTIPGLPSHQNPRFLSQVPQPSDPSPPNLESDLHSIVVDHGINSSVAFGVDPDLVSQESVDSAVKDEIFGTDHSMVSKESPHSFGCSIGAEGKDVETVLQENEVHVDLEQVENVVSVLQSSLAGPLESRLDEMTLDLSEEFVVRVIQTPEILGDSLFGFFDWVSKKPGVSVSSRVIIGLVNAIGVKCRKKEVYKLWDLVMEIGEREKELLNTKILNGLILLFWKLGKGKAGLEVFDKFDEFGCNCDSDSYYLTIEALIRRSMFDNACGICEKMIESGQLPDDEKVGKLIVGLCKGSKVKEAYAVYRAAIENEIYPPKSPINFMVNKLSGEDETVKLAAQVLKDFSGASRKLAIRPFTSVIRGMCRMKDVNEAKKLLQEMVDEGPPPGNAVFNFVITGLSKAGEMDEAISLMKLMESRGLRPDLYTYNAIVSGYANGGQMDDACNIFAEAKKTHSKLCPVIYHTLIRGFCKLEEFDKALKYFSEMKEYGVKPNVDEYNKLIQSLCLKALDWQTSEVLLEEMKENGLYLNGMTRGLIKAVKELEADELQSAEVKA